MCTPALIEAGYSLFIEQTQMRHIFSLNTEIPHQLLSKGKPRVRLPVSISLRSAVEMINQVGFASISRVASAQHLRPTFFFFFNIWSR